MKKETIKYLPVIILIPAIYLMLIGSLFIYFDTEKFVEIITSKRVLFSLKLSVLTSTLVACISTLMAIPVAYILSRKNFLFKSMIDVLIEIPLVVSPAALGAMILIFFNTSVGYFFQEKFFTVVLSINGIIVAQVISTVAISIRLIKSVMDEVPKRYEQIAMTLGASAFQSFYKITLPLSIRGILASFILVWAKSIGEFGATMTVAGTMPLKTETLPIAIYLYLSSADVRGTVVLILISIIIGVISLSLFRYFTNKSFYD
ncbi:MAG: ABC transporter permease [Bacteroidia bacterium]|nr:MAG: ABC transporter permease [Bacteroidia bacterium]